MKRTVTLLVALALAMGVFGRRERGGGTRAIGDLCGNPMGHQ